MTCTCGQADHRSDCDSAVQWQERLGRNVERWREESTLRATGFQRWRSARHAFRSACEARHLGHESIRSPNGERVDRTTNPQEREGKEEGFALVIRLAKRAEERERERSGIPDLPVFAVILPRHCAGGTTANGKWLDRATAEQIQANWLSRYPVATVRAAIRRSLRDIQGWLETAGRIRERT